MPTAVCRRPMPSLRWGWGRSKERHKLPLGVELIPTGPEGHGVEADHSPPAAWWVNANMGRHVPVAELVEFHA